MNIKCPHCGTEYDIEQREFGKYVTCQVCNKGFVAGARPTRTRQTRADAADEIETNRNARPAKVNSTTFSHGTKIQSVRKNPSMAFTRWSFDGRALRSEYWPTILILTMLYVPCVVPFLCVLLDVIESTVGIVLSFALWVVGSVFCFCACLPVTVRRLHDVNLSGWWLLLFRIGACIPYVGWFAAIAEFIIVGCLDGTAGENKYGSDPKGRKAIVPRSHVQEFSSMQPASQQTVSQQIVITHENSKVEDVDTKIKKLAELKNLGLLTEEEYKAKKGQILKDF